MPWSGVLVDASVTVPVYVAALAGAATIRASARPAAPSAALRPWAGRRDMGWGGPAGTPHAPAPDDRSRARGTFALGRSSSLPATRSGARGSRAQAAQIVREALGGDL